MIFPTKEEWIGLALFLTIPHLWLLIVMVGVLHVPLWKSLLVDFSFIGLTIILGLITERPDLGEWGGKD